MFLKQNDNITILCMFSEILCMHICSVFFVAIYYKLQIDVLT